MVIDASGNYVVGGGRYEFDIDDLEAFLSQEE